MVDKFTEFRRSKGMWRFISPLKGVVLEKDVNRELLIKDVLFVDKQKLPYIRRRLGIPMAISELVKTKGSWFQSTIDECDCVVFYKKGGPGLITQESFLETLNDEINILALSQLGFVQGRRFNANIWHNSDVDYSTHVAFKNNTKAHTHVSSGFGYTPNRKFFLNEKWCHYAKKYFFRSLLKLIQNPQGYEAGWINDIENAAIMAGKSQRELSLSSAFLWNMIAIETLITKRDDKHSKELPHRIESFMWWSGFWDETFKVNISDVYKARCGLVHAGKKKNITSEYLFFTDVLLFNIFNNIINNVSKFKKKADFIEFSNRIQAAKVLDVKPEILPNAAVYSWSYSQDHYINLRN